MRRLGQIAPVLVVLAAAFVLRAWGLRYCLPYGFGHVDEDIIIRDAMRMGSSHSLRPTFFDYPALYTYLSLAGIGAKYVLFRALHLYASPNDLALEYALRPGYINIIGRMMSVIAGTLTVGLTYALGRRVANVAVGLGAAVLMALASEHVTQSHWALPDVTMTLLFTAALYLAYRLVQTGSLKTYAACGLLAGLAISTKYNAGPIVPVLFLAHILRVRAESPKSMLHILDRRLALGAMCVAVGFLVATPYWLLDPKPYYQAMQWNQSHMKMGHLGASEGMRWLWIPSWLLRTEKALGVLMLLGFAWAFVSRRKENTLLVATALIAFLVTGSSMKTSLYFFLPAYPALCILGAQALEGGVRKLFGSGRQMLLVPVALLIAIPQIVDAVRFDAGLAAPDTRLIARDWIERRIPSGSTVAIDEPRAYCAPIIADNFVRHWSALCPAIRSQLARGVQGMPEYRIIGTKTHTLTDAGNRPSDYAIWSKEQNWFTVGDMRKQGARYIILSSYNYERYQISTPPTVGNPLRQVFMWEKGHYEGLMSSPELDLLKTISPGKRNLGPTILIYRIKPHGRQSPEVAG